MVAHDRARERASFQLADSYIDECQRLYGPNGETPLEGHDQRHIIASMSAMGRIMDALITAGLMSKSDVPLGRIATAAHDRVQRIPSGKNELRTARLTAQDMEKTQAFSSEDIDRVQGAIVATTLRRINGQYIQLAGTDILEKATADADLSSLGAPTPTFIVISNRHKREQIALGMSPEESDNNLEVLLATHKFYTEQAEALFPHQYENLAYMARIATELG